MATVAEPVVFEIPTQCRNCQCGIRWEDELGEFVHWANEKSRCPSDAELASYRPAAS